MCSFAFLFALSRPELDFEESELLEENVTDTAASQQNDSAAASPSPAVADGDEDGSLATGPDENNESEAAKAACKDKVIKLISVKNSGEDGELNDENSDDDLEEGELKDEDDPVNQSLDVLVKRNEQKNIPCKFYSIGQCTWGEQCRFMHCDIGACGRANGSLFILPSHLPKLKANLSLLLASPK